MPQKTNWMDNPTKKQMSIIVTLALTGFILMILSMTNFFKESPFQVKYFMFYIMMLVTSMTVFKVCKAYIKNNK